MFGSRFYEQYGEKPNESWREAVEELRPEQVKEALRKIRNGGGVHPPSLPEFVALARNTPVQRESAAEKQPDYDDFHRFGQLELLKVLLVHRGVSPAAMPKLIACKNRLVDQFSAAYGGDRDRVTNAEWDEWREIFQSALNALHAPPSFDDLEEIRRAYCAQRNIPFTPRDRAAWDRWDSARARESNGNKSDVEKAA